jgi:transcription elongation factor GreB
MSRWRERGPAPSPYITAEGYRQLEQECKSLWQKREQVRQAVAAAAAEGDRSENAEYIYRKKQLREIDRRIAYLQKRLPELNVPAATPDSDRVFFSATVTLEDDAGNRFQYRIVGPDEIGRDDGWISVDSPLARTLLGKCTDDEVCLRTRKGEARYIILCITY